MKCHNCGFDAENNAICPICGETMPENTSAPEPQMNADSNTNPYQQPAKPQYNAPQQPANHFAQAYENPYSPQYENPYAPQTAAQYSPQHYESPYAQQPAEPQYNAPHQPTPSAQNAQSNYPVPVPPQKSNGAAVVIIAVVASVVAVGIIIAILSVTLFKNSIFNIPDRYDDNYYNDYYDDYDYDYEDFNDNTIHEIGETFAFDYGEITLKNVEIAKKYDDGKCQYAFTVEVKNVTSEAQTYELWYDLLDSQYNYANSLETEDIGDEYMEFIYTEGEYNYSDFELKSGEATEFIMYYKSVKNDNTIYPEITLSDYDYLYFSGTTHYKVDLSKLTDTTEETTNATTEAITEEATKATKNAK